jgi:protein-disulfide isomerase-like protein with CxxC motif
VSVTVTYMTDPGCPWAYSALPAVTALRWRYGDQLDWRVVTIGLAEDRAHYERRGYRPVRMAGTPLRFARFGMPFALGVRERVIATGPACRAIVAARLEDPEHAYLALRALHLAWFTTTTLLDEPDAIAAALAIEPALDAGWIVARIGDADVEEAYRRDRAEVREAAGSPAELQGKTARSDGPERYTAPTLIFAQEDTRLVAGGHQSLAAYDVLLANLPPPPPPEPPPENPRLLLERSPHGLTTREIARTLAADNDEPDDDASTQALLALDAEGEASVRALGSGALWRSTR